MLSFFTGIGGKIAIGLIVAAIIGGLVLDNRVLREEVQVAQELVVANTAQCRLDASIVANKETAVAVADSVRQAAADAKAYTASVQRATAAKAAGVTANKAIDSDAAVPASDPLSGLVLIHYRATLAAMQ